MKARYVVMYLVNRDTSATLIICYSYLTHAKLFNKLLKISPNEKIILQFWHLIMQ